LIKIGEGREKKGKLGGVAVGSKDWGENMERKERVGGHHHHGVRKERMSIQRAVTRNQGKLFWDKENMNSEEKNERNLKKRSGREGSTERSRERVSDLQDAIGNSITVQPL